MVPSGLIVAGGKPDRDGGTSNARAARQGQGWALVTREIGDREDVEG